MSQLVHDLIRSLSAREKAWFKRYSGLSGGGDAKNYLRLYEALVQQRVYDPEALQARFAGESLGRHLHSELNYLMEQVLKSLLNFHMERTHYRQLIKMSLYVDMLIEKGFRKQGLKILHKAKKLAYYNEEFSVILKLIQQEEEILFREGVLNFTEKLRQLKEERQIVTDKIQNVNELRLLREQTRELQFTDSYVTDVSKYPHIFDNPLMRSEASALSIRAKEHWYYIQEIRYYLTRRYREGQAAQREFLAFMEGHRHFFKSHKMLSVLSNFLLVAAILCDREALQEGLDRLDALAASDQHLDRVYIGYIRYGRLLEYYYNTRDKEATDAIKAEFALFLRTSYGDLMEAQANYSLFLIVRAHIDTGDYEGAVDWLNFWSQGPSLEYTLVHRRLFTLIAYHALGWNELLEAALDTTYKNLKSHRKYNKLSKAFLSYFRNCLRNPTRKTAWLQQLHNRLSAIRPLPEENKEFEYFDFLIWCEEEMNTTPY